MQSPLLETIVLPVTGVLPLILVVVRMRRRRQRVEQSSTWPSVSGTVLRSAVTYKAIDDSSANSNKVAVLHDPADPKEAILVRSARCKAVGGHSFRGGRVNVPHVTL